MTLKTEFFKLEAYILVSVLSGLNNHFSVDLNRKLTHVASKEVLQLNLNYIIIKIKKIHDAPTLILINQYHTDKQNLEKMIFDKKMPSVSGLVIRTFLHQMLLA